MRVVPSICETAQLAAAIAPTKTLTALVRLQWRSRMLRDGQKLRWRSISWALGGIHTELVNFIAA